MERRQAGCEHGDRAGALATGIPAVFIVGSHRSGTSILCRLLAASGAFNVVTAFHVLNRDRLLELHNSGEMEAARLRMADGFRTAGLRDEYGRPVTPDTLEEYAFALKPKGRRPELKPENLAGLLDFCHTLQAIQDPLKPLLLKNPFDTARFLFIREAFPRARFIFIHRHPARIIDSQIRLLRQIMDQRLDYDAMMHDWYREVYDNPVARAAAKCIFSRHVPLLLHWVQRSVSCNCDYILRNIDSLGASATGVTYTGLCRKPADTVAELLVFAGVKAVRAADYGDMMKPSPSALLPEVARRMAVIEARNREYCRRFGVESESRAGRSGATEVPLA